MQYTRMELADDAIHLYFTYPEEITDPGLLDRYQSLLSEDELVQMGRFYYARHRHQYLLTRALVRTSLSNYYPVDPAAWKFSKNDYGKPEICHPDINLPIQFNLSHTRGLILCGITRNNAIGVDVEDTQRTTRAALADLSSYFSMQEIEDLNRLPTQQQMSRFYDYWTLKESYIKARGMGLAIPLRQFSFHFVTDRLARFSVDPELKDDAGQWQFWRIALTERYRIAIATRSANYPFTVKGLKTVPLKENESIPLVFL